LFLTYVSSHNFGLTVIEEGVYDEASKTFSLESTNIGRSSTNKPPEVTKVSLKVKFMLVLIKKHVFSVYFRQKKK
jgi:hypothetical protein